MDIVNFDALKAQGKIIDPSQVDPNEDYFIIGKYTKHYTTNSYKYTDYPVYAIKAGDVIGTPPAYKVYSALLSQSGTNAPVVTVLENTIGNIVWSYNGIGDYRAILNGAFTSNKTFFTGLNSKFNLAIATSQDTYSIGRNNNDSIYLLSGVRNNSTGILSSSNNILDNTSIEIRVYN